MDKKAYKGFIERYSIPILAVLILAVYIQTVGFDLVFCDDHEIIISRYDRISDLSRWDEELFKGYIDTNYYRPVVNLSFLFDAQVSGQEAYFYHITNIMLHFLFVILLFITMNKLGIKKALSFFAAALFAVHPLFTNAVAWIAGRNDLLLGLFSLLSLYLLIKHYETKKGVFLGMHLLSLLLAFLSKETAFVFPAVLYSYLILFKKERPLSKLNIRYVAYWTLMIFIAFAMRFNADLGKDINRMGLDVFLTNLRTIPEYVAKFILPVNQSGLPAYSLLSTGIGIIFIILIAAVILYRKEKQKKNIYFGLIWFLGMILPTIFFTILNSNDWNEYLECRAYLPSIGLLIILLEILPASWKKMDRRVHIFMASGLILIFGIVAFSESRIYRNSIIFYESVVADNPGKALYQEMLSNIYLAAGNFDLAEKHIRKTIEANPDYSKYYSKIAKFYYEYANKPDSALKYYRQAKEINPDNLLYYNKIATINHELGNYRQAIKTIKDAFRKWPREKNLYLDLISLYFEQRKLDSAFSYTDTIINKGIAKKNIIDLYSLWAKNMLENGEQKNGGLLIRKAYQIDPTDKTAMNMLYYFYSNIEINEEKASELRRKISENR